MPCKLSDCVLGGGEGRLLKRLGGVEKWLKALEFRGSVDCERRGRECNDGNVLAAVRAGRP